MIDLLCMKLRNKQRDIFWCITPIMAIIIAYFLIRNHWTAYYVLNDDWGIRSILSGAYLGEPSDHALFLSYPLSWILSGLYKVIPGIPWYALFYIITFLYCFVIICIYVKQITKEFAPIISSILATILFFSATFYHMIYVQFTLMAAIPCATSLFLYGVRNLECCKNNRNNIHIAVCVTLGYSIRENVLLMCIPFWGMIWLVDLICTIKDKAKSKKNILNVIQIPLFCCIIVAVIELFNYAGYNLCSSEWNEYKKYEMDYVIPVDYYGWPDYDGNIDLFNEIDMSVQEYGLLRNKNILALDNGITPEKMHHIAERSTEIWENGNPLIERLSLAIRDMFKKDMGQNANAFKVVNAGLCFVIVILGIIIKNIDLILKLVGLYVGRFFAWIYVLMQGRFPSRIAESLLLIEFFVLMALFLCCIYVYKGRTTKECKKTYIHITELGLGIFIVCLSIGFFIWSIKEIDAKQMEYKNQEGNWDKLTEYCAEHSENFYVLGTGTLLYYVEKVYSDFEEDYQNYIVLGTWQSRAPLEKEKLERQSIYNLEKSIIEKNNIFLIYESGALEQSTYILDYFNSKYDSFSYRKIDSFKTMSTSYDVYRFYY